MSLCSLGKQHLDTQALQPCSDMGTAICRGLPSRQVPTGWPTVAAVVRRRLKPAPSLNIFKHQDLEAQFQLSPLFLHLNPRQGAN